MHGSIEWSRCLECGGKQPLERVVELLGENPAEAPECPACVAPLKPDVVLFGELLPEAALAEAQALCAEADLLLCVGSSLEVYPVAALPAITLRAGGQGGAGHRGPDALRRRGGGEAGRRRGGRAGGRAGGPAGRVIAEGEQAPDFTLPDQDGGELTLSSLRGETVVLYFYPRANTPGCTTQACGIRDRAADYRAAGVRVLGVSPDPVKRVKKFHEKKSLDFTLLADEDHSVADAYGVWVEKSMYGKKYWGAQRATFIIDAGGKVARMFPKVSPKTHDEVVLGALRELAG